MAQNATPVPEKAVTVGVDLYAGLSDIPGQRRPTDQLWAGQTVFTPSVVYATWAGQRGTSARLALGVGGATLRTPRLFPQPVEAWVRQGKDGRALTLGRFFAPFGQQEWQFQARNGAMVEVGRLTLAAQERGMLYGRWSAPVAPGATLGVSAASGRGFSYGSVYNRGAGLDLAAAGSGWQLRAESDRFYGPFGARFRFDFARLEWTRNRAVQPFVSRYDWHDSQSEAAGALGSFRSEIVGATWPITPQLSLETATARASGRRVAWAQVRFTASL
jgi:hypothetical protein